MQTSILRYDAIADSWTTAATVAPSPVGGFALMPSGLIYIQTTNGGMLYDPIADSATLTAPPPVPLSWPSAMLLPDGRILAVGSPSWVYDPALESWAMGGSPPPPILGEPEGRSVVPLPDGSV